MSAAFACSSLDRREAALEYARMGWALVPLAPRSKLPHHELLPVDTHTNKPSWRILAAEHAGESDVRAWFRYEPELNIAMICGSPSGGIVVVDFDVPVPYGPHIPLTPRVVTGRGEHLYLHTTEPVPSRGFSVDGERLGEVRGENSYVVVPPSVHPTGAPYEWAELLSPHDLDWQFAEPPEWVSPRRQSVSKRKAVQSKQVKHILYSLTRGLAGDELGALAGCDEFVQAAAPMLGIDVRYAIGSGLGKAFPCILPNHSERNASASLFRRRDGLVVYHDWHRRDGKEFYALAEVYASRFYGRACKVSAVELAVWQLRLLVDAGLIGPAHVPMPELEPSATPSVERVYNGFKLLLGCKWLHTPGEPTPFSWRFASVWCGVSQRHAGAAMASLIRSGAIQAAGHFVTAKGGKLTLFLPGKSSSVTEYVA